MPTSPGHNQDKKLVLTMILKLNNDRKETSVLPLVRLLKHLILHLQSVRDYLLQRQIFFPVCLSIYYSHTSEKLSFDQPHTWQVCCW